VAAPRTGRQRHRDPGTHVARRAEDLDAPDSVFIAAALLRRRYGDDDDAVHLELGFGAQNVAHPGTRWEQGGVDHTSRLTGTRGAPSPRSVVTLAGQLDVESPRHGRRPRYPHPEGVVLPCTWGA